MRTRTERIDVRATAAAKEILRLAAAAAEKDVGEFLLDAGLAAAAEALTDRHVFSLDETQWRMLQDILGRPQQEKPRLAKLLSEPSVLE